MTRSSSRIDIRAGRSNVHEMMIKVEPAQIFASPRTSGPGTLSSEGARAAPWSTRVPPPGSPASPRVARR